MFNSSSCSLSLPICQHGIRANLGYSVIFIIFFSWYWVLMFIVQEVIKSSSRIHGIIIKQYWVFAIWNGGMLWNQDLRCTFQEANPSPIHLFKILLPKFIHRVVFHYITQIIISDFKDFRMKYLEDKSPILLLFMQFNPSFKSRSINKDCSRSAPNPKNSSLLWRSLLPLSLFAVAIPIQRNHCFTFSWKIWMG